ncbi:MAG: alanine/ornithine racemase family PLP-dependent enzyme [Defluviitaleaceae bacterium]|nr:alanine/ornithine racemase family PLP-dependent enzyme [Defluviitaleaceae bacterium]
MKYPALIIDLPKLAENIAKIQAVCNPHNINFCAVTKCFCAAPEMVEVYYNAGIREFADTRLSNLDKINYPDITKWLLRLPQLCEADDVVRRVDISLNSEISTVAALSAAAAIAGVTHKVILMIDVGDLREGVLPRDAVKTAAAFFSFDNIELYGIGVNFNCFGGVIPTAGSMAQVADIAGEIERKLGIKLKVISGGNSGSMHLLSSGAMPSTVNNLRLGEVVFFGRETSYQQLVNNMHEDIFRLDVQIIELKTKPSKPIGEIGLNAFGEAVEFDDRGEMLRAIVAAGRQDVDVSKITPLDADVEILGQSSDHMILNLTNCAKNYKIGDIVSFGISYGSLLSLSTSEYINKIWLT